MAFDRLQKLGVERFRYLINALVRGTPAQALARTIQQEWHEHQDMAEDTLTKQLQRLREGAAEGMFGKELAKEIINGHQPQIKLLAHVSPGVLERMEELAAAQRTRYFALVEKEKMLATLRPATNAVFVDYKDLLKDIQKMRFDLGVDEFKGVVPGMRGASVKVTSPDGSSVQRQVWEAMTTLETLFDQSGIAAPIDDPSWR